VALASYRRSGIHSSEAAHRILENLLSLDLMYLQLKVRENKCFVVVVVVVVVMECGLDLYLKTGLLKIRRMRYWKQSKQ